MITFLIWWLFGVVGSIGMALGTNTDGEGIDSWDFLFLAALSFTGPCMFLLSIPFWSFWIGDKFK